MQYQSILLLATLAASALANPSVLDKRQSSVCEQQRSTCGAAPGANQSLCAVQKNSCDACEVAYESYVTSPGSNKSLAASLRNECFAASAVGAGDGVVPIISSLNAAQNGGAATSTTSTPSTTSAQVPGTTTVASVCDQQRLDCGAAPGANQSLCAVQKNSCDACEAAYEAYVTSPGSNKSFAASLRNECFAASKEGSGDGVVPIISSFSAAQAGGASATPTTAVVAPTVSASTTPTETASITTITFINPVGTVKPTSLGTGAGNFTTAPSPASTQPPQYTGAAGSLKPMGAMGALMFGAALVF